MREYVAAFTVVGVLAMTSAIVMGANETVHELVLDTAEKELKVKQEFKEAKKIEKNPFK